MNTISVSTRVVKAISVAVAAIVLFVSNPLTSLANGGDHKKAATLTEDQVNVQYVGTNDNSVVFRVAFENPTAEKFWLIIKNDNGEVVYRKQFSDAHFAKSVYFQKEESDIHPTFVIRNGDNEVVRQFAVNRTITENTVVTKL
ncbi:MAG TPA: hypothetical protein VL832_14840 [Puia sp.]|jgi:hypothetical protein|nr:hypothetical protein [Puia sp.]